MGRSAAAGVIWDNPPRHIGAREATAAALRTSALAVYGAAWYRAAIINISTDRFNYALGLLRNYAPLSMEYRRLESFLKEAYASSPVAPSELREWRTTSAQIRIELSFGWGAILEMAIALHPHLVLLPFGLGRLKPADFQPLTRLPPIPQLIRTLWTAARSADNAPPTGIFLDPDFPSVRRNSLSQSVYRTRIAAG